jgi:hypothetical protein|eukprot:COSAG06_NODE_1846_length_8227_cov_10.941683_10_plen_192_part_00
MTKTMTFLTRLAWDKRKENSQERVVSHSDALYDGPSGQDSAEARAMWAATRSGQTQSQTAALAAPVDLPQADETTLSLVSSAATAVTTAASATSVTTGNGGGACESVSDCNWGGACSEGGACICDPTWTGSHCSELHLLPAVRTAVYPPDANSKGQSTWTWGAAAVSDEDGRVHLYLLLRRTLLLPVADRL